MIQKKKFSDAIAANISVVGGLLFRTKTITVKPEQNSNVSPWLYYCSGSTGVDASKIIGYAIIKGSSSIRAIVTFNSGINNYYLYSMADEEITFNIIYLN